MFHLKNKFLSVTIYNPLLSVALAVLFSMAFAFHPHGAWLLSLLVILYAMKQQRTLLAICSLVAWAYGVWTKPIYPEHTIQGFALCSIHSISSYKTHFARGYLCKGTLISLEADSQKAHRIPCSWNLPATERPLSCSTYRIYGTLEKKQDQWTWTAAEDLPWEPISENICLAEKRFNYKMSLLQKIKQLYPKPTIHAFLGALTLGTSSDPLVRHAFNRLGLQHILAISGFHFGILTLALSLILQRMCSIRWTWIILLCMATLYFLLLGASPSITRAYLALVLYGAGHILQRTASPLNIFSAVLLIELLIDPQTILHSGFQLSFLATISILWLYPVALHLITYVFPVRLPIRCCDRLIYALCTFFRTQISLNIAVHCTMIPVSLFVFGTFPIMSLAYNLYIPMATGLGLIAFVFSIPMHYIPYLGDYILKGTSIFLDRILHIVEEAPTCFDISWTISSFSLSCLLVILWTLFLLPLFFQLKNDRICHV